MALDIRGSLKNTKLSSNRYVVIEEMISNSIDSFLIRRSQGSVIDPLTIDLSVNFHETALLGQEFDISISCEDNGCGFGVDQLDAFLTKDTSYKDDLAVVGIGRCKGSGRIQFFHHFNRVGISSSFREGGKNYRARLEASDGRVKIDSGDFVVEEVAAGPVGAKITASGLKSVVRDKVFAGVSIEETFSASSIRRHMLMNFLQRFVSLEKEISGFKISFKTRSADGGEVVETLSASDLPSVSEVRRVQVQERDSRTGSPLGIYQEFTISHYKLGGDEYQIPSNNIALCAKSSPVKDITQRYLRTRTEQNELISGFHHLVLVEGDLFDRAVNDQRDDFQGIPSEIPVSDMFVGESISYSDIYEVIDPVIDELVAPVSWSREVVVKDVAKVFGISASMLAETNTRVVYGDNARAVAERVLKKYQERIIIETEEISDLKDSIIRSEPFAHDFREKISELSWRYASSLKNFDMANLSQLVVRRAAIVEVLSIACGRGLEIQLNSSGRRQDEKIIHSIFFPMRKDNKEASDHDIWLLNEEYQYYDYISSDMPLSKVRWASGENVFDPGVDGDFEDILKSRYRAGGSLRPDIAIFSEEGSAIIVEFKSPGVSMDDHIGDLSEYAHLLAAKSGGRIKKFYGYLIGDTVNRLRMTGYTRFPTGNGYFRSSALQDPDNGKLLGEIYEEVLFFSDVVDRARKRIEVYKDRLNLEFASNV